MSDRAGKGTILWIAAWAAIVLGAGAVLVLVARAERGPTIRGAVQDREGRPVPAADVGRAGDVDQFGNLRTVRTDARGRFVLRRVPEGDAEVVVQFGREELDRVRTEAGADDVMIVVDPGPTVDVRITDYVPVENERYARLTWPADDERRHKRHAPIGEDGRIRFVRLPPEATFELWALARPGRPVRAGGLRAQADVVDVTSIPGETIRGRILVEHDGSIRRASVSAAAYPRFMVGRATIEDDGSFVISELPPGRYRVAAHFSSGAVSIPVEQEVEAGTSGVVFDLREDDIESEGLPPPR